MKGLTTVGGKVTSFLRGHSKSPAHLFISPTMSDCVATDDFRVFLNLVATGCVELSPESVPNSDKFRAAFMSCVSGVMNNESLPSDLVDKVVSSFKAVPRPQLQLSCARVERVSCSNLLLILVDLGVNKHPLEGRELATSGTITFRKDSFTRVSSRHLDPKNPNIKIEDLRAQMPHSETPEIEELSEEDDTYTGSKSDPFAIGTSGSFQLVNDQEDNVYSTPRNVSSQILGPSETGFPEIEELSEEDDTYTGPKTKDYSDTFATATAAGVQLGDDEGYSTPKGVEAFFTQGLSANDSGASVSYRERVHGGNNNTEAIYSTVIPRANRAKSAAGISSAAATTTVVNGELRGDMQNKLQMAWRSTPEGKVEYFA
jgi:hypothetical protein